MLLLVVAHHAELAKLAPVAPLGVVRLLEVDALAIVGGVGRRLVDAVDVGHLRAALRLRGRKGREQREEREREERAGLGHGGCCEFGRGCFLLLQGAAVTTVSLLARSTVRAAEGAGRGW